MELREARFKRGLTQFDLRLRCGIHQSKVSLIERGYIEPTEDEKRRLAKALSVKPEQLEWNSVNGRLG